MDNLSAYVLTRNSEKYLEKILSRIVRIADEVVIVDSGSTDRTASIAASFPSVKWMFRTFDNFRDQRNFAAASCSHRYVLFLDSDEIPDEILCNDVLRIRSEGFRHDAYNAARHWIVLGKKVRCIYPIESPDYPVRLFDKSKVHFAASSGIVHETPEGYESLGRIGGTIFHHTFETRIELARKLDQYTDLAAENMAHKGKHTSLLKRSLSPPAAFIKWYFLKGGWQDGTTGFTLGKFAFNYTRLKYRKANRMRK